MKSCGALFDDFALRLQFAQAFGYTAVRDVDPVDFGEDFDGTFDVAHLLVGVAEFRSVALDIRPRSGPARRVRDGTT